MAPTRRRPSKVDPTQHDVTTPSPASESNQTSRAQQKRRSSDFFARFLSGTVLTLFFFAVARAGHIAVILAILVMETGMFHEILRLGFPVARRNRIPWWRTTGWYFFIAVLFLFYAKPILSHFEDKRLPFMRLPLFEYMLMHHSFIAFCIYCFGFVGFVLHLKQDQYQIQFTYFGRALVALLLVVVQSHFMILNVTQGLIWFILPSWLIVCNDSFGYFCGRLFGKHSLTALSPKKTWEGYIGAGIFTMITAFLLSGELAKYPSLVCPKYDFNDCFLICPPLQCDPVPQVFLPVRTVITLVPGVLGSIPIIYRPVQLHAIALGLFAASIAPFGGFFASGAKRAFGIKDFGQLLPGHGGVTDRVDCQLMMAVFTYVYLINFVKVSFVGSPDVGKLMSFVSELSAAEQVELMTEIYTRLKRRGVDYVALTVHNATISR